MRKLFICVQSILTCIGIWVVAYAATHGGELPRLLP